MKQKKKTRNNFNNNNRGKHNNDKNLKFLLSDEPRKNNFFSIGTKLKSGLLSMCVVAFVKREETQPRCENNIKNRCPVRSH